MSRVAEFISWKRHLDGNGDGVATLIAESITDNYLDTLEDTAELIRGDDDMRQLARLAINDLDDYLEKEGLYEAMKDDKSKQSAH